MKRPLVVLAAGYVLGEVLALQDNTAVDLGVLAWLCAAAAGILWLLDTWRGGLRPSAPKEKMQGRSNRKHRVLLLFLVCLLSGSSLGMARGWQEKEFLDHEESVARTMAGARCKFSCRMQSRPTSTPYRPLKLLTWSESS